MDCYINGRRRRKKCGSYDNANKMYRRWKQEELEGVLDLSPYRPVTVKVAIDRYQEVHRDRPDKMDKYHAAVWIEQIGTLLVDRVTRHDIEVALANRVKRTKAGKGERVKPDTLRRELGFLKRVCRKAVEDRVAKVDPTASVAGPKETPGRVRCLTSEELAVLAKEMGVWWPVVLFAILTGLRQANQFALRWDQVNFVSGFISIMTGTKNQEALHVPLNNAAEDLLRALPSFGTSKWVFPNVSNTGPFSAANFTEDYWRPALRRAGIEDFRWHDLRHCFASYHSMAGTPQSTLQVMIGHKSARMTQRYSHLSTDHIKAAAENIGFLAEPTPKPTPPTDES